MPFQGLLLSKCGRPVRHDLVVLVPEDKFKVAKHAFPQGYRIRMDVGPRLVANLA